MVLSSEHTPPPVAEPMMLSSEHTPPPVAEPMLLPGEPASADARARAAPGRKGSAHKGPVRKTVRRLRKFGRSIRRGYDRLRLGPLPPAPTAEDSEAARRILDTLAQAGVRGDNRDGPAPFSWGTSDGESYGNRRDVVRVARIAYEILKKIYNAHKIPENRYERLLTKYDLHHLDFVINVLMSRASNYLGNHSNRDHVRVAVWVDLACVALASLDAVESQAGSADHAKRSAFAHDLLRFVQEQTERCETCGDLAAVIDALRAAADDDAMRTRALGALFPPYGGGGAARAPAQDA